MSVHDTHRVITSLTNDTVKAVRALHMRKEREATGTFLAEGLKFIGEALDQGRAPRMLLVGQDARPHPLLDRVRDAAEETREAEASASRAIPNHIARDSRSCVGGRIVASSDRRNG